MKSKYHFDNKEWEKLNDLVLKMTEEKSLESLRFLVLEKVNELIPNQKSFMDLGYRKSGKTEFLDPISLNMSKQELKNYYEIYASYDFTSWILESKETIVYRDSDFMTEAGRDASEIYQGWMKPMNIYYSLGSVLVKNQILYGSITLFRNKKKDFTNKEIEILDFISQHFAAQLSLRYPHGLMLKGKKTNGNNLQQQYGFTPREMEIIDEVMKGNDIDQISRKLFISSTTVKKHLTHIFRKADVKSRLDLMHFINQEMN